MGGPNCEVAAVVAFSQRCLLLLTVQFHRKGQGSAVSCGGCWRAASTWDWVFLGLEMVTNGMDRGERRIKAGSAETWACLIREVWVHGS